MGIEGAFLIWIAVLAAILCRKPVICRGRQLSNIFWFILILVISLYTFSIMPLILQKTLKTIESKFMGLDGNFFHFFKVLIIFYNINILKQTFGFYYVNSCINYEHNIYFSSNNLSTHSKENFHKSWNIGLEYFCTNFSCYRKSFLF